MTIGLAWKLEIKELQKNNQQLRAALRESNSLFAAMLLEKRPDEEIEKQITENNRALSAADGAKP